MTPSPLARLAARALVLLLLSAARSGAARAQAPAPAAATSAPIVNVRYDVSFDRDDAARHRVRVATSFEVAGGNGAPVLLSLPDWTPGAYEISYFARWVENFAATDDGGRALEWDKLDFDTWRVHANGAKSVTVTFDYAADTLDNAMAWTRPDFLLFNGTNIFLYPEGRSLDFGARVTVHTDPGWRVATGMTPVAGTPRSYTASNYHDLVDMPFFVGHFDIDSARIVDRWVRYATYPAGSVDGPARQVAWDQLRRVIPAEARVFGEVPWNDYTVMQIADSAYQSASGLEHQSSHVDVVSPLAIGSDFQPSLYAHEIFHSWNVKRLRPADLWPYVYDRAEPTPWLWVSEGITDYYADLAEVRGGVTDDRGFYALTAAKITETSSTRPVALEDASLNTWIHPVDGTQYTYYGKGSLAGFLLDILIRDASDNRRSLDEVMRELYQTTYKHGRGFTAQDWWSAVSRAASGGGVGAGASGKGADGRLFEDFNRRYVDGREPYPWSQVLPLAGLRMTRPAEPRLGVYTVADPSQPRGGLLVTQVDDSSSAAAAGVRPGDYLLSVADIPVTDQRFGERFRARYDNAGEGAPLAIRVRRGSETLTLAGKLHFVPGDVHLDADPTASAKAVRIRTGILTGRVDP
ncbi:MAG TPA: PDZ domain-containing protein [Gemmatimonadaceae bacterium]|nr:PDZ domain-containing protein [Gemmatimonadaceae bacterium]